MFSQTHRHRIAMTFTAVLLFAVFATVSLVFSTSARADSTAESEAGPRVLASTAWVASIAEAAGAENVDILASFELRHPPERDFRPSDIVRATEADVIAWAGYENFIHQIVSGADIDEDRVLHIQTENNPDHLIKLTRELAESWGTEARQRAWEDSFTNVAASIKQAANEKDVRHVRVISTVHLVPYLNWLGYDVVETFGFEEMTPRRIHELVGLNADLIVDVWHNPAAEALSHVDDAPYVALINFPGHADTRTLIDVFTYNAQQLNLIQ